MSLDAFYFGCWGSVGHFLVDSRGRGGVEVRRVLPPSLHEHRLDGQFCGDPALAEYRRGVPTWPSDADHQPEGRARLTHVDGWTVLAFWDRSVDSRGGSNSAFLFRGTLGPEEALAAARAAFPSVWARFTFAVTVPLRGEAR